MVVLLVVTGSDGLTTTGEDLLTIPQVRFQVLGTSSHNKPKATSERKTEHFPGANRQQTEQKIKRGSENRNIVLIRSMEVYGSNIQV